MFAPLTAAGGAATYDPDVLYTVNIDTTNTIDTIDNTANNVNMDSWQ